MVAASVRPYLASGVALAALGALALPMAPAVPGAAAVPPVTVHVEDVALAGIGQDVYYAITPWVQYAVGGASYLINFIPLVGGLTAAQINIGYYQGIQPSVEATVNYLAGVVQNPLNFLAVTQDYLSTLYAIGYNWVSAELRFLGFPELPPLSQGPSRVRSGAAVPMPAAAAAEPSTDVTAAGRVGVRPPRADAPAAPSVARAGAGAPGESPTAARKSLRGGHSSTDRTRAGAPRSAEANSVQRSAANRSLRAVQ